MEFILPTKTKGPYKLWSSSSGLVLETPNQPVSGYNLILSDTAETLEELRWAIEMNNYEFSGYGEQGQEIYNRITL